MSKPIISLLARPSIACTIAKSPIRGARVEYLLHYPVPPSRNLAYFAESTSKERSRSSGSAFVPEIMWDPQGVRAVAKLNGRLIHERA